MRSLQWKQGRTHCLGNTPLAGTAPERVSKLKLDAFVHLSAVADIGGIGCLEMMAIVLNVDTGL